MNNRCFLFCPLLNYKNKLLDIVGKYGIKYTYLKNANLKSVRALSHAGNLKQYFNWKHNSID